LIKYWKDLHLPQDPTTNQNPPQLASDTFPDNLPPRDEEMVSIRRSHLEDLQKSVEDLKSSVSTLTSRVIEIEEKSSIGISIKDEGSLPLKPTKSRAPAKSKEPSKTKRGSSPPPTREQPPRKKQKPTPEIPVRIKTEKEKATKPKRSPPKRKSDNAEEPEAKRCVSLPTPRSMPPFSLFSSSHHPHPLSRKLEQQ
jgi:hypothetical protein